MKPSSSSPAIKTPAPYHHTSRMNQSLEPNLAVSILIPCLYTRGRYQNYEDLAKINSSSARDKGLYRMENKEYLVEDGNVLLIKVNL